MVSVILTRSTKVILFHTQSSVWTLLIVTSWTWNHPWRSRDTSLRRPWLWGWTPEGRNFSYTLSEGNDSDAQNCCSNHPSTDLSLMELTKLCSTQSWSVTLTPATMKRKYTIWIGESILASPTRNTPMVGQGLFTVDHFPFKFCEYWSYRLVLNRKWSVWTIRWICSNDAIFQMNKSLTKVDSVKWTIHQSKTLHFFWAELLTYRQSIHSVEQLTSRD